MTISITVSAYNPHTAGPLRLLKFHVNGLVCSTGREDQFAHAARHGRSIIDGLRALEPLSEFTIRAIDTDAHGAGIQIDGVDLFEVQSRMEKDLEAKRGKQA